MPNSTPPWLATMQQITGTQAQHDNPTILGWAKFIGDCFPPMQAYCATYTHDTIPWCGLTVAYCMAKAGIQPVFGATDVDRFLFALSWRQFGSAADAPQSGDVLVFDFGNNDHHVTLFESAQGDDTYICRGGNQSHEVKVSNYPKSQCIAVRRPPAPGPAPKVAAPALVAQHFSGITATVFGGAADKNTSAYDGHVITDTEFGVALPARIPGVRPKVRVWKDGKCVDCDIVDVGPWNTNDPYWQTGSRPQAESGVDMRGRPTNHAGIDLTPATAKAIGVDGKGVVEWEFIGPAQAPQTPVPPAVDAGLTTLTQRITQLEGGMTPEQVLQIVISLVATLAQQSQSGGAAAGTPAALIAAVLQALSGVIQQPVGGPAAAGGQAAAGGAADPVAQVLQTVVGTLGKQVAANQAGGAQPAAAIAPVLQALTPLLQQLQSNAGQAGGTSTTGAATTDPLQLLLGVLLGKMSGGQPTSPAAPAPSGSQPAAPATTDTSTPPVLTTIDKLFGGQALAGSKTLIAVVAFAIQLILTFYGAPGVSIGGTAGNIIATVIGAFGGLGMISKVDRVVQLLGMIANKQPPAPPPAPSN
jgi:uncharacterized protein (TIGR02594 family)